MSYPALQRAIELAGGQSALARLVGQKQHQNIQYWLRKGKVPAQHCKAVEDATGVSRAELRPDLFADFSPASDTGKGL